MRHIQNQIGPRTLLPLNITRTIHVRGWSIIVPNTRIHIDLSTSSADILGSFPTGTDPIEVTATVFAFPGRFDIRSATQAAESTLIPDYEAEAWVRVLLGEHLADYAYQLVVEYTRGIQRPPNHQHKKIFAVLVDGHGNPLLAPDNISWRKTSTEPRKLEPAAHNIALHRKLQQSGPYTDAAQVRDTRTDAQGRWLVEVTGDPLDTLTPIARETVKEADRQFRIRGAIHTDLRPERIIVEGESLWVQFRWKKNPNIFAISAHIPQSDTEFRSPKDSPLNWIAYTSEAWFEELSTGLMWTAPRDRHNGVIRLGKRRSSKEPYSVGGVHARPDLSGLIHIPRAQYLLDLVAVAYQEDNLISWSIARRHRNDNRDQNVAQAVTAWTDTGGIASLQILDSLPNTPDHIVRRTAFRALHDAADAGSYEITTTLHNHVLEDIGFVSNSNGTYVLDVLSMH